MKLAKIQQNSQVFSMFNNLATYNFLKQTSPIKLKIDYDDIRTSMKIINNYWWVLDEILILESPDSFSTGTYTESNKALCRKSLATTD